MSATPHFFGKLFLNLTWVLLLIGLGLFFNQYLNKKNNPNQNPRSQLINGYTEVILKRNPQHHYLANGTINGTTVTFLVDTGATLVALSDELAKKLNLTRGLQGTAHTANGTTTTYSTTLNSLTLGAITFKNIPASITLGMQGNEVLLGMSVLKEVELVHKNGELRIRQGRE